jgi:hypothetical protein
MRWAGHDVHTGERRGAYRVLVGKPEGKNRLQDLGVNGSIILKMDLQKVGWDYMDWIRIRTGGWNL